MRQSTEGRLFHYAWLFKKGIMVAIVCLIIATALELAGPLIAKRVIDEHILGVEGVWYGVDEEEAVEQSVTYHGQSLSRMDDEAVSETDYDIAWSVIAVGKTYYITEDVVPFTGKRSVDGNILTIESAEGKTVATVTALSAGEVARFFALEKKPIILLLMLYMGLLLIAGVFQFFQTYLLQKSSNQIVQKMRNDIFTHTQTIPIDYFTDQPAGKIVARITNDTEAMRELYERVLSIVITRVVYMVGILVAIYILEPKFALLGLIIIPIIYIWMRVYKYFGSKYNLVIRKANSEINGNINESIQGMPIIQAFQIEEQVNDDFNQLNNDIYVHQKKLVKLGALTNYNLVNVLRNLTFVGFIWYFGNMSMEPTAIISIGMLYALVDYCTRFFEPVTDMVNQFPLIEQARAAGDRMFALLDTPGKKVEMMDVPRYEGEIEFRDVTFSYDGEEDVLKGMNFSIYPGETAAFVGHTGSGKSSTMNLLFRFYDPQKGQILIDGKDIQAMSSQAVRSHMGIVLQDPFLFSGTILSNVTMGDPRISKEAAIQALHAVGADTFIARLPKQYDEPVTEGGSTFSLGERQLISFARALAFDPAILILDEATANIDTETEQVIQEALEVLKAGRTTLIIAHRLSTIKNADKIFVLERGTMKEKGDHSSLIAERGIYYQMYEMQQGSVS